MNPFLGAFRLIVVIGAILAVWNGGGLGAIIVAAVLYFLLSGFLAD